MAGASKFAASNLPNQDIYYLPRLVEDLFIEISSYLTVTDLLNIEKSGIFEQDEDGHAHYITVALKTYKKLKIKLPEYDERSEEELTSFIRRCPNLRKIEPLIEDVRSAAKLCAKFCPLLEDIHLNYERHFDIFYKIYIRSLTKPSQLSCITLVENQSLDLMNEIILSSPNLTTITIFVSVEMANKLKLIDFQSLDIKHVRLYASIRMYPNDGNRFHSLISVLQTIATFGKLDSLTLEFFGLYQEIHRISDKVFKAIESLKACNLYLRVPRHINQHFAYLNPSTIVELNIQLGDMITYLEPYKVCSNLQYLRLEVDSSLVQQLMEHLMEFNQLKKLEIAMKYQSDPDSYTTIDDLNYMIEFLQLRKSVKILLILPKLRLKSFVAMTSLLRNTPRLELDDALIGKMENIDGNQEIIKSLMKMPNFRSVVSIRGKTDQIDTLSALLRSRDMLDFQRISGKRFYCYDAIIQFYKFYSTLSS